MRSYTSHTSEHGPKTTGSNNANNDKVIAGAVYFNVNKIYKNTSAYGFESILEISGSAGYCFKITQTRDSSFYFTDNPLQPEEFKTIVKELFDDTITALSEHMKQRSTQNIGVPAFVIPDDTLSAYFLTANYHNLLLSCTLKTIK